ncbi:MAG TPA: exopolysaccharide biosynthesis polyprenyl glycosylphosphotransferase [Opitutus sp.]|nr:exopolysaccharide biosynthesis polyprenyl glycosylphosphotransferase [Opitutus sp.]
MTTARKTFLLLLVLDFLCVLAAFNTVSYLRGILTDGSFVVLPLLVPAAALAVALYLIDGYNPRTDMISVDYTSLHTIAVLSAMLAVLVLTFVMIPSGYELQSSRIVIVVGFVILAPATLNYRRILYQSVAVKRGSRSLAFLGDEASCLAFRDECERMGSSQPVVYCSIHPRVAVASAEPAALPVRPFDEVLQEIENGEIPIEAIVLRESGGELPAGVSQKLVALYFRGVPTYTLELFHQVYWRKIPLYRLNQTWLFQEGFRIAREPVFERIKRATDIGFALLGLLLASPLIVLGAIAVWLEDGRPFFYVQNRVGRNHVRFPMRKLRTMRVSSDQADPYTRAGDRRVTRVGRFLRATRIDELPQLWNVLKGDMSLIGPRAEWDRLVANYEREIPCYHFRHLVKPGITGWAQVNYPYGANTDDTMRKLEYDLYYIRHFSFLLDASILLKTVHIMLFGKGR